MRISTLAALLSTATLVLTALPAAAVLPAQPPGAPPATMLDALSRDLGISHDAAAARLLAQDAAEEINRSLPARIREQSPGSWLDEATGRLLVAVTDDQAAAQTAALGATPVKVTRDRAELRRLSSDVARLAAGGVPGLTGWGIDPVTDTVTVRITAAAHDRISEKFGKDVAGLGDGVRITYVTERPSPQGGDVRPGGRWLPGGEANCSIGFPATDGGGGKHFLTAGHCTNDVDQPAWGSDGQQNRIGTSNVGGTHSVFGREGDMGLVGVTEPSWGLSSSVNTSGGPAVEVTGATDPLVNQAVCHAGVTTGWQCGKVTAVDQTVVYTMATLEGITHTTACSLPGDSGGAWLAGTRAVGLHSGGYSSCSPGGARDQSLFQPVREALGKWGLTLHTAAGSGDGQAPTTPTSLRAAGITSNTATLEWNASTDNVGVTGYRIYNGTTLAATSTTTKATVGDLAPASTYTFTVKAVDANGNLSAASAPVTVQTSANDTSRTFTATANAPIRDFQTTAGKVTSTAAGTARTPLTLTINASHSCIEDLDITLTGPSGQNHVIHRYGGYTCHPLAGTTTYNIQTTERASGTWTLSIHDGGPGDTGTLERWTIAL
ncbi:proprotein convertase P-domain-containing protein [Amycolatopsis pittospori]|uniref:proprotein convertase P-domain-containing protein n=1 Tax=Amycolatopsis pittospori TaxID=2749434 RepID=UPI0015F0E6D9|nr:proprotein convertase P-domain-containing protein [Amycolatopsis pittospori]